MRARLMAVCLKSSRSLASETSASNTARGDGSRTVFAVHAATSAHTAANASIVRRYTATPPARRIRSAGESKRSPEPDDRFIRLADELSPGARARADVEQEREEALGRRIEVLAALEHRACVEVDLLAKPRDGVRAAR